MRQKIAQLIFLAVLSLPLMPHSATAQGTRRLVNDLKPTVILISVDGFRADYLDKYPAPTLSLLAKRGVRARWMTPAFPSLTFPNHYTIATGLYPDNHGIVGNNIYDPEFKQIFTMAKREEVQNGRWWLGEPIWVTSEKQGQRAAAFFFPGTEAEIGGKRPSYWKVYDEKIPNFERVDKVLSWLDLLRQERPTMITMYFSDIDQEGHESGPDSEGVRRAIAQVDEALGRLVAGLKSRRVFDRVNLYGRLRPRDGTRRPQACSPARRLLRPKPSRGNGLEQWVGTHLPQAWDGAGDLFNTEIQGASTPVRYQKLGSCLKRPLSATE